MVILRDPIWQFAGVFFTLFGIFVSVLIYARTRKFKEISYEVMTVASLLDIREEIRGQVKIVFDNIEVDQVHLIIIKIINSGTNAIKVPDTFSSLERPINFSFGEKANVLSAKVGETNPQHLEVSVRIEDRKVVVNPSLINRKNWFTA